MLSKKSRLIFFAFLIIAACASASLADTPTVRGSFNINNMTKARRWAIAHVRVENPGPAADFTLVVSDDSTSPRIIHRREVSMPERSAKNIQVFMYVHTPSQITYELYRGGTMVASGESQPWIRSIYDAVVMAVNSDDGAFGAQQMGPGGQLPTRMLRFANMADFERLPHRWVGYDSVDALVVGSLRPDSLTVSQERAMLRWVRNGGLLILSPTDDADWLRDSFLAPASPVEIIRKRWLSDFSALTDTFGPGISTDERIPVWEARPVRGDVLLWSGQLPMIATSSYGAGKVVFLGFDASDDHVRSWDSLQYVYWHLLEFSDPLNSLVETDLPSKSPSIVMGMVGAEVVSAGVIALLLLINIALFLAAYLLFRRRRSTEWAWLVTAVAAPLFALLVYFVGAALSGIEGPSRGALALVRSSAGSEAARVNAFLGVISTETGEFNVRVDGDDSAFIAPMPVDDSASEAAAGRGTVDFLDEDIKSLMGVALRQRSISPLHVWKIKEDFGSIDGRAVVTPDGIAVEITNNSTHRIRSPFVAFNRNIRATGDLAPGASTRVTLDNNSFQAVPKRFTHGVVRGRRDDAVAALYTRRFDLMREPNVRFFGWVEDSGVADNVDIEGLRGDVMAREEALWVIDLPWGETRERALVPKGAAWVQSEQMLLPWFRDGEWIPASSSEPMTFTYRLPVSARNIEPERITLYFSIAGGRASHALQAWNFRTESWDDVQLNGGQANLASPADYYDRYTGAIRARASMVSLADPEDISLGERLPWVSELDVEIEGIMQ